jgi:hypothetical protein
MKVLFYTNHFQIGSIIATGDYCLAAGSKTDNNVSTTKLVHFYLWKKMAVDWWSICPCDGREDIYKVENLLRFNGYTFKSYMNNSYTITFSEESCFRLILQDYKNSLIVLS